MTTQTAGDSGAAATSDNPQANGRIPINNIWLLMLWASVLYRDHTKHLRNQELAGSEEDPENIPNLIAEVLAYAVELRLKRNLSYAFRRRADDLRRVRGRIDLLRTERFALLDKGLVACRFDELTVDTPPNQYVMAALIHLARRVGQSNKNAAKQLSTRCRSAASALAAAGVTRDPRLDEPRGRADAARQLRYNTNPEDRLMLAAAQLAFDLDIPTEQDGTNQMYAVQRDDIWLRRLFEQAVAGFFRVALSPQGWRVHYREKIHWNYSSSPSKELQDILPSMEPDIMLNRSDARRIVIDTKFTDITTPGWHRPETLRSGYIYQIYAYVRSQERNDDPASLNSTGVLLHPAIDDNVDESADIQGHRFRFMTVDLSKPSADIRDRLMAIPEGMP